MKADIIGPIITVVIGLFAMTIGMGCSTDYSVKKNTSVIHGLRSQLGKTNAEVDRNRLDRMAVDNGLSERIADIEERLQKLEFFRDRHAERWPDLEDQR